MPSECGYRISRSSVMSVALQAYNLLKVAGRSQGLDTLRQDLSGRFARTSRRAQPVPVAQPEPQAAPARTMAMAA